MLSWEHLLCRHDTLVELGQELELARIHDRPQSREQLFDLPSCRLGGFAFGPIAFVGVRR